MSCELFARLGRGVSITVCPSRSFRMAKLSFSPSMSPVLIQLLGPRLFTGEVYPVLVVTGQPVFRREHTRVSEQDSCLVLVILLIRVDLAVLEVNVLNVFVSLFDITGVDLSTSGVLDDSSNTPKNTSSSRSAHTTGHNPSDTGDVTEAV